MTVTNYHGPHHLFCGGCSFDDTALAAAAWAGSLAARGLHRDAEESVRQAKELNGRVLMNWPYMNGEGEIQVRLIRHGDRNRPSAVELAGVIDVLQIQLDAIRKCEAIEADKQEKKREAESATAQAAANNNPPAEAPAVVVTPPPPDGEQETTR